jgi:hypothetical protein
VQKQNAAKALIQFLPGPSAASSIKATGMEPIAKNKAVSVL